MNLGIKRNERGNRIGDSHHRSKLTDHEVELVRRLRADGMLVREIARKFGVSRSQVSKILRHLQR